ncbi:MAG: diacylglycerol kinase family protein [Chitinophagales bacterium]|nr:diacylglycerol kinase family protein [Chitinophagales bacterium]
MLKFLKAFSFAGQGLLAALRSESNMRFHLFAAIVVIVASTYFQISRVEWMFIILCIASVVSVELLNTAIEKLSDKISTEFHPVIKTVKDVSAGAVLISALMATIIGLLIFIPHLLSMVK